MKPLALALLALLPAPARAEGDPVACDSDQYRDFLGSLGTELYRGAVQFCLDDIRRVGAAKAAQSKATKNQPLPFTFHPVDPASLPTSCAGGSLEGMKTALRNQLASCAKFPPGKLAETRKFGCRTYTRQEWCVDVNTKLLALAESAASFGAYLEKTKTEFDWVMSDGWPDGNFQGKAQFTAYHGPPPIDASATPTAEYNYPVYRHPADLVKLEDDPRSCGSDAITGNERKTCQRLPDGSLQPFPDRNAIDNESALKGRGLEIAWVKDPVEVAFLMVEGSGSLNVRQPDGSVKFQRINYDGGNGRTLNMLGRILLCQGAKPDDYSSLKGIKAYLAAHPSRLRETLAFDQSYVFFKPDDAGPFGADDIPVTPRHTFAADRRILPTGSAMLFHTKRPGGKKDGDCDEISSMALSQDSGGAINGPHVDWYLGEGEDAQSDASAMNEAGSLFVALPKGGGTEIHGCAKASAALQLRKGPFSAKLKESTALRGME